MNVSIDQIKQLREETGAGVMDVKKVLEETKGNIEKSKKILMEKGLAKMEKRADKEAGEGLVFSYIHSGAKVGSLLLLGCETDFVAKTEDFQKLGKELAMQVATDNFADTKALLESEYIRDPGTKINDLIGATVAKLGEKIEIRAFTRYSVK